MPKQTEIKLSFLPYFIKKLIDFDREHRMQTAQGTLKNATICRNIIEFVLELRDKPLYNHILSHEGGTLFMLVTKALGEYAARHGYIRKGLR